jgi:protein gp37
MIAEVAAERQRRRWDQLGTRISWCHFVWNWWTGCAKVSAGCAHCYAETWAKRAGRDIWGPDAARPRTGTWSNVRKYAALADDPDWRAHVGLKPGERPRVFCGSLMDWAENRDFDQRAIVRDAWSIIGACPGLDFLLLTKRPQNIPELLPRDWGDGYPNVWLMTSVESDETKCRDRELGNPASWRLPRLLAVPAVVHGVSYEPALGPLAAALEPWMDGRRGASGLFAPIDWVIYGGESGPGHRPEGTPRDPKLWAREMRDACRRHGVAFFHKQSGHRFNERGVELDGELLHEYPVPRIA